MAKKSRTPPPPRPVQAPKRRTDPRDPRRTRILLIALAGAAVLAAAIGGVVWALGRDEGTAASGSCERETFPAQGRTHVDEAKWTTFKYNSTPPTSGPHDGATAIWSVYTEPVGQGHLVHNLEHGGIIVQYGERVPAATVDEIEAWYRDNPNGIIVAPLPKLGNKIALTAWTHLMTCSTFDEDAFSGFRDDYRAKGPEPFELEHLPPGSS